MRATSLLLMALSSAVACGQADEAPRVGTLAQPIMGGQRSDATQDSVVYLYITPPDFDRSVCTGTLVAPNLVATALHCVTFSKAGFFSCAADGSVEPVNPGDGNIGSLVPADSVEVYVGSTIPDQPSAFGARLLGTNSIQICRNDLAFVVLDRNLEAPIAPVRLSGEVRVGELVDVVGYGETEVNGTSGRVTRSGVRIIDVGPTTDGEPTATASPRTFVVNEGPCHGDSGGPALSEETGALLGVYSLTAGRSCTGIGIRNIYTSLPPFSALALEAFEAAGAEPLLEEAEPEPERPPVVAERGCSLGASPVPGPPGLGLLLAGLAAAGLGRRRRQPRDY